MKHELVCCEVLSVVFKMPRFCARNDIEQGNNGLCGKPWRRDAEERRVTVTGDIMCDHLRGIVGLIKGEFEIEVSDDWKMVTFRQRGKILYSINAGEISEDNLTKRGVIF